MNCIVRFTILFALLLPACRPKPTLAGAWVSPDGSRTWHFTSEGAFTLDEPGTSLSGTYLILNDGRLELTFAQYDQTLAPQLFVYTLTADTLTLSSPTYGTLQYQRLPD